MITVVKTNGDVHFINENEYVKIKYEKEQKQVIGLPIQHNAKIGIFIPDTVIEDVVSVCYTNQSQPTSLLFHDEN